MNNDKKTGDEQDDARVTTPTVKPSQVRTLTPAERQQRQQAAVKHGLWARAPSGVT